MDAHGPSDLQLPHLPSLPRAQSVIDMQALFMRAVWLGALLLLAGPIAAQTATCYSYGGPWSGSHYPTPQLACGLGGTHDGPFQCQGYTCSQVFKVGTLVRGSRATHDEIYECNTIETITGSDSNCNIINPGHCGVFKRFFGNVVTTRDKTNPPCEQWHSLRGG